MAALPCFAGEVAVLKNGFSILHERREVVGESRDCISVLTDRVSWTFRRRRSNILRPRRSCRLPVPGLRLPDCSSNPLLSQTRAGLLAKGRQNQGPEQRWARPKTDLNEVVNRPADVIGWIPTW